MSDVTTTSPPPGYPSAPRYPKRWETDAVLKDGGTVHVRPIRPDDGPAHVALISRLSEQTLFLRFFSVRSQLTPQEVERFTHVDYDERMALVGELDDQLVAIARYDRIPGTDAAEVAFVVDDAHQGRGLGTLLLEHLAAVALDHGIHRFEAEVLPQNRRMLGVFRDAGFVEVSSFEGDVVQVTLRIEPTEASLAAMHERERVAAVRSIQRLLQPRSIAVIGAGRQRGSVGHEIFRNLLRNDFAGPVYPVNPYAPHVASIRPYPQVTDVPEEIDLAVIAVPAAQVAQAVEECGAKRVRSLIVISGGFADVGPEGEEAERDLVRRAHSHGMRLLGPNSMGIVNTSPNVSMNATYAPLAPRRGRLGVSAHSGALGIAILQEAAKRGMGVSTFVSLGNRADVSSNDLLRYWEDDEETDAILLYAESFGNPRTFARVASEASRKKPVVILKSGRAGRDPRSPSESSHDLATDALFRQAGVIRVDNLEQLVDAAQVLVHQPLPPGRRVAIVGNAGGPNVLAADACDAAGLDVIQLASDTQDELRSTLPPGSLVTNPVEIAVTAGPQQYERAVKAVIADTNVDALLLTFTEPLVAISPDVQQAILTGASSCGDKPVLGAFLAPERTLGPLVANERVIPVFRYPEFAVNALAAATEYAEWRRRPEGVVPELGGIDERRARLLVDTALVEYPGGLWLDPTSAIELLDAYAIPITRTVPVVSADEAVEAALALGYPVALKLGSPLIPHRSDVGGVRLGLTSADEVRTAFADLHAQFGDLMAGAVIQAMEEPGVEAVVGVTQDPSFGPLVTFRIGGAANLGCDRAYRILPLTDVGAAELVRSTRCSPLLFGYGGLPTCNLSALEELVLRVGRLVQDVPEVVQLDLDPVIVSATRAVAVDAKVRLAFWVPRPELAIRRLH